MEGAIEGRDMARMFITGTPDDLQKLGRDELGSQTGASSDGPLDEKWQARNLTTSLSKVSSEMPNAVADHDTANGNSLYAKLWREVNPMLLPNISHLPWDHFTRGTKKVKTSTVRNTIKLRHGTFCIAKLAKRSASLTLERIFQMGLVPFAALLTREHIMFPAWHVLGACTHKLIKGVHIERHNEAVATVSKAIMEGAKGGCLAVLMADARRHGKVTGLSNESRIPNHVLPDVPEASLGHMRPDILLFEKSSDDSLPTCADMCQCNVWNMLTNADNRRDCKVHVIEVGFCTEISYFRKFKEKSEQHTLLLEHLRNAGYAQVQLHLMIFGSTGGMFRLTASHLMHLGIAHSRAEAVLQAMHWKRPWRDSSR